MKVWVEESVTELRAYTDEEDGRRVFLNDDSWWGVQEYLDAHRSTAEDLSHGFRVPVVVSREVLV